MRVIDLLEPVDVQHHHGASRSGAALGPSEGVLQRRHERASVGQASERVCGGEGSEVAFPAFALGDVVQQPNPSQRFIAVADLDALDLQHPACRALHLQGGAAFPPLLRMGGTQPGGSLRIQSLQELLVRQPDQCLVRDGQAHPFHGDAVQQHDPVGGVFHQHTARKALQQHIESLALDQQGLVDRMPIGDVGISADHPGRQAGGISLNSARTHGHPFDAA